MRVIVAIFFFVGLVQGKMVCFSTLGCFSDKGPFRDRAHRAYEVLPDSPREIGTKFLLYSKNGPLEGIEVKYESSIKFCTVGFDPSLPLKVIIHGYLRFSKASKFVQRYQKAFLARGDYNVIVVTWVPGSKSQYWQAAANSRVVGAEIAKLIKLMKTTYASFNLSKVHLIGHSLGAHIAGYAGEKFQNPKLGRITGLDPAGPYFRGTSEPVRLDRSDAAFVDVVHTNGGSSSKFQLGIFDPIGHSNFYVNGGHYQPGCRFNLGTAAVSLFKIITSKEKFSSFKEKGIKAACSHNIAHKIFEYTISPYGQPLTAYHCRDYRTFSAGACLDCSKPGNCVRFGIDTKKTEMSSDKKGAKYFMLTGVAPNFYGVHLAFKFFISRHASKRHGRFYLHFLYNDATGTKTIALPSPKKFVYLQPGATLKMMGFLEKMPKNKKPLGILIWYKREKKVKSFLSWFGFGSTRLDRLEVYNAQTQTKTSYCLRYGNKMKSMKRYWMPSC